jgi:hypothetical protein
MLGQKLQSGINTTAQTPRLMVSQQITETISSAMVLVSL